MNVTEQAPPRAAEPHAGSASTRQVHQQRPVVIHGRPRSREGEEAYERSAREQAAIDIAAGW